MEIQQSPSVIALQCPKDVKQHEELCQSVAGMLKGRSPTSVVRTVQDDEELALQAGDMHVVLRVDEMTESSISAHLEWQVGDSDIVQIGPQIEFTVIDTTLRPALFDQFAKGLAAATPELLETLP